MTEPSRPSRPLPKPPLGNFLVQSKPDHPRFKNDVYIASLRLLKESDNYQPGFDQQNARISALISIIQLESTSNDIKKLIGAFDEAFAYCLAAKPGLKEKDETNLTNLRIQIRTLNTYFNLNHLSPDPVIKRIESICDLILDHIPSYPSTRAKPRLQRTSSDGDSPSPSRIYGDRLQKLPTDSSDYAQWLGKLRQYPLSADLSVDCAGWGEALEKLDGALAYCIVAAQTVNDKIENLEKFRITIACIDKPYFRRMNQICEKAIKLLRDPPLTPVISASVSVPQEHPKKLNIYSWNLIKIALITTIALGGIATLFMGYKYQAKIVQKGLQAISWIRRNISNKNLKL